MVTIPTSYPPPLILLLSACAVHLALSTTQPPLLLLQWPNLLVLYSVPTESYRVPLNTCSTRVSHTERAGCSMAFFTLSVRARARSTSRSTSLAHYPSDRDDRSMWSPSQAMLLPRSSYSYPRNNRSIEPRYHVRPRVLQRNQRDRVARSNRLRSTRQQHSASQTLPCQLLYTDGDCVPDRGLESCRARYVPVFIRL